MNTHATFNSVENIFYVKTRDSIAFVKSLVYANTKKNEI